MRNVLVVIESDGLLPKLNGEYSITTCRNAKDAAALLHQNYDGMVLDLFLPGTDGLTLLEQTQDRLPPVILVLTRLITPYILQAAASLGVGYVLPVPCSDKEIAHRLEDMFRKFESPETDAYAASARYHLRRLGISTSRKGGRHISFILPDLDPKQDPCLFSDFYPPLAKKESVTVAAIDNAIHREIQRAYNARNDAIWREYFSDTSECPKNKDFLCSVAEKIREKTPPGSREGDR